MANLTKYAMELVSSLQDNQNKDNIKEKWYAFATGLNAFSSYDEIPNDEIITIALFEYTRKLTSNDTTENKIRFTIAFLLIRRIIDSENGIKKITSQMRLFCMLWKNGGFAGDIIHHSLPDEIAKRIEYGNFNDQERIRHMKDYFIAMLLYLYEEVKNDIYHNEIDTELKRLFDLHVSRLMNDIHEREINEMKSFDYYRDLDGKTALNKAFQFFILETKPQLYAASENSHYFYKISKGLIQSDFIFYASQYLMHESDASTSQGNTSATIEVQLIEKEYIEFKINGIKKEYLTPAFRAPLTNIKVLRWDNSIQISTEHSWEEGGTLPWDCTIVVKGNNVTNIVFSYMNGRGGMRTIIFIGNQKWSLRQSGIIPNIQLKKQYISEQYLKYGDCDIMLFVTNMYRGSNNFFSWLFEDSSLNGMTEFQLDPEHYEAWKEFYNSFDIQ